MRRVSRMIALCCSVGAASAVAGCGASSSGGATTPSHSSTGAATSAAREETIESAYVCRGEIAHGLQMREQYDYVELTHFNGSALAPIDSFGTACPRDTLGTCGPRLAEARDRATAVLSARFDEWNRIVGPRPSFRMVDSLALIATRGDAVELRANGDEILDFVAPIDTIEEAALVLSSDSMTVDCGNAEAILGRAVPPEARRARATRSPAGVTFRVLRFGVETCTRRTDTASATVSPTGAIEIGEWSLGVPSPDICDYGSR